MPNKDHYLVPVLVGGGVAGILSSIPFVNMLNCLFCMWMLLGAGLAVMLLQNKTQAVEMQEAAVVGALAGVVCAVISWAVGALFTAVFGMSMIPAGAGDMGDLGAAGGGILLQLGISCIVSIIAFPLFGALGGLLGGVIFKPKPGGGAGGGGGGSWQPPPGGGAPPPGGPGGGFGAPPSGPGTPPPGGQGGQGGGFGAPPPGGGGFGQPPGGGTPPPQGGGFGQPPGGGTPPPQGGGFGQPPGGQQGGGFGQPPGGHNPQGGGHNPQGGGGWGQ